MWQVEGVFHKKFNLDCANFGNILLSKSLYAIEGKTEGTRRGRKPKHPQDDLNLLKPSGNFTYRQV
jgi:hypothetical protein